MDELALERARQRIAQAAAGRTDPATLEAALERSREGLEALAATTAELESNLPTRLDAAMQDAIRAEVVPVARNLAEIRGMLTQAMMRL